VIDREGAGRPGHSRIDVILGPGASVVAATGNGRCPAGMRRKPALAFTEPAA